MSLGAESRNASSSITVPETRVFNSSRSRSVSGAIDAVTASSPSALAKGGKFFFDWFHAADRPDEGRLQRLHLHGPCHLLRVAPTERLEVRQGPVSRHVRRADVQAHALRLPEVPARALQRRASRLTARQVLVDGSRAADRRHTSLRKVQGWMPETSNLE